MAAAQGRLQGEHHQWLEDKSVTCPATTFLQSHLSQAATKLLVLKTKQLCFYCGNSDHVIWSLSGAV